MKGFLRQLDDNGDIVLSEEININLYKYGFEKEPLGLVSLFSKFPDEDLERLMIAITSFPKPINTTEVQILPRFLVYYRGMD